jgi:hypothetical protein
MIKESADAGYPPAMMKTAWAKLLGIYVRYRNLAAYRYNFVLINNHSQSLIGMRLLSDQIPIRPDTLFFKCQDSGILFLVH